MTIAEFKAWLEGYSASMGAAPTAEQWDAIRKKIDWLTDAPVYCPPYRPNKYGGDSEYIWPTVTWSDNEIAVIREYGWR